MHYREMARAGLILLAAGSMACSVKKPESVIPIPTKLAATATVKPPEPVSTPYSQNSGEVLATVVLITPGKPESGTVTYQFNPQVLIRQRNVLDFLSNQALDIRIDMETNRLTPPGSLTINVAPQLARVETLIRIGRMSENRPRDAFLGTTSTWELRPSHTVRISWLDFCINSIIADGDEQITTKRCPRPVLNSKA